MARDRSLDIAVTGIAARFPGVPDLSEWWSAVREGRVLTRRYERDELIAAGVPKNLLDDPDYVPVHGHLADADRFDHTLFRVSPREAEMTDPQHRLMLEAAWTALEDAGTDPSGGTPRTGVYATASPSGYLRAMLAGGALDDLTLEDALHGTEPDFVAGLIAYRLGLRGPALAVRTACSSSLVAVHLAVQGLLDGDCEQAVVVGAGVPFPQAGRLHIPGGIHSATGRCRPFDASADGVVAGSGVVAVVLRRLADALADGSDPHGVILGTAINNDASAKAGFYAPSAAGQEAVIRAALRTADVDAASIGYLEAHATGTRVGDPIEWSAASAALGGLGARPGQVAVGALKANVGHLDNAAGVAALVKALMVVKEGVVPPVAGFERLNPLLETDGSPLFVPPAEAPWTGPDPRRAGVSAFGIGGTNAHVIVEQAPKPRPARPVRPAGDRLVLLSAADPGALTRSADRLRRHLTHLSPGLTDVSATLAAGRAALPERLAVTGRTSAEVAERLATSRGPVRGRRPDSGPAPVVLLFPGQGSQYPGMARPLADALPGFAAALDACLAAYEPALADRLRPALLEDRPPAGEPGLTPTEWAQPALFAVGYAAATALRALGITPAALVGHSLGELTAACVAGVLDLPDAARIVTARGRAMQECPPGAMLGLGCDETAARDLVAAFGGGLEVAAVNGPGSTVVAGSPQAVRDFRTWLADRVHARPLRTDRAFHSSLVEPALEPLAAAFPDIRLHRPALPFASNATGRLVGADEAVEADHFVEQARRPVRFADCLTVTADHHPDAVVVEVGPRRTLSALAEAAGLHTVPLSPARTSRPAEEVLRSLGTLWTLGQPVDAARLCAGGQRLHLPGYPFAGRRWLAPEAAPRTDAQPLPALPHTSGTPAFAEQIRRGGEDASPIRTAGEGAPSADTPPAPPPAPPPATDPAVRLAALWSELLGHDDPGEEADFFHLGGDSLLITRLVRRVNQEFGIQAPIRAMLSGRTLARQTALVRDLIGRRPGPSTDPAPPL
ncbi:type I polyketide synthase [Streptomyces sp. NPDC088812]|uniref:type I polyketide synthase n=1 Tax=Streptomyces sp. NPDC088812 TaxID=3365905 RepID=UPI0038114D8F